MVPAASFAIEFPLGCDNWPAAARIAGRCTDFSPDTEEEQVADEALSCYNCRYRRWSASSVDCCRQPGR